MASPSLHCLSRARFEGVIGRYRLTFDRLRVREVEYAAFPPMVPLYQQLAIGMGLPPTQHTFARAVAERLPHLDGAAVLARAGRTYPSLIRQHHAYVALAEHFDLVVWDALLDLDGLDLLAVQDGLAVGICLSTDTPSAHAWRAVKDGRHLPPEGLPILEVWADPDEYRVGPFWLHHPERTIDQVEAKLELERRRIVREHAGGYPPPRGAPAVPAPRR